MLGKDLDMLSTGEREILFSKLCNIFDKLILRFKYSKDSIVWNMVDHWENYDQIPDKGFIVGDCDCFALACRKECRKNNLPSRLVFCKVNIQGVWVGHLVLECAGFIFDCMKQEVVSNIELPYKWVSISGYEKGDDWHAVSV